jgi:hypothetical protein
MSPVVAGGPVPGVVPDQPGARSVAVGVPQQGPVSIVVGAQAGW